MVKSILFSLLLLQLAAAQQNVHTVFVVRDAERASAAPDASLSTAGLQRAECLAQTFKDSGITQIFVTDSKATQLTAAPLAQMIKVKPSIIPARDTSTLVRDLSYAGGGNVLVVGQTNTIPVIVTRLQGGSAKISDNEYDRVLVITVLEGSGTPAASLRYCPSGTVTGKSPTAAAKPAPSKKPVRK